MLKVDLHLHTSDDPVDRIPYSTADLIDRAAELGFGALAVTLHDKQLDTTPLLAYAAERGIVLIPGIERTVRGKHVLLLNFTPDAGAVRSFDDIEALKRQQPQGLVIAPHPYFPLLSCLWGLLDEHANLFDAVEVNGMFTETIDFNAAARQWARTRGKPLVGNGDVHRLVQLGTTYSLVDATPEPDAICQAIRGGHVQVVATPHAWTTAVRVMGDLATAGLWPDMGRPRGARRAASSAHP